MCKSFGLRKPSNLSTVQNLTPSLEIHPHLSSLTENPHKSEFGKWPTSKTARKFLLKTKQTPNAWRIFLARHAAMKCPLKLKSRGSDASLQNARGIPEKKISSSIETGNATPPCVHLAPLSVLALVIVAVQGMLWYRCSLNMQKEQQFICSHVAFAFVCVKKSKQSTLVSK